MVSFHRKQNISLQCASPTCWNIPPGVAIDTECSFSTRFNAILLTRLTEWNAQYLSQVVRDLHSENDLIVVWLYLIFFGTWRRQRGLPLPTQRRIKNEKLRNHFKKTSRNRHNTNLLSQTLQWLLLLSIRRQISTNTRLHVLFFTL